MKKENLRRTVIALAATGLAVLALGCAPTPKPPVQPIVPPQPMDTPTALPDSVQAFGTPMVADAGRCVTQVQKGQGVITLAEQLIAGTGPGEQYPKGSMDEGAADAILGGRVNVDIDGKPVTPGMVLQPGQRVSYDETARYNLWVNGVPTRGCNINNTALATALAPTPAPTEDSDGSALRYPDIRVAGGTQTDDFTDKNGEWQVTVWNPDNPPVMYKNFIGKRDGKSLVGVDFTRRGWEADTIGTVQSNKGRKFDCTVILPPQVQDGTARAVAVTDYTRGGEPQYKDFTNDSAMKEWKASHPNKPYSVTFNKTAKCGVIFKGNVQDEVDTVFVGTQVSP